MHIPVCKRGKPREEAVRRGALYPFELALQDQLGSARELPKVRPQHTWSRGTESAFGPQPCLVPNLAVLNQRRRGPGEISFKPNLGSPRRRGIPLTRPISTLPWRRKKHSGFSSAFTSLSPNESATLGVNADPSHLNLVPAPSLSQPGPSFHGEQTTPQVAPALPPVPVLGAEGNCSLFSLTGRGHSPSSHSAEPNCCSRLSSTPLSATLPPRSLQSAPPPPASPLEKQLPLWVRGKRVPLPAPLGAWKDVGVTGKMRTGALPAGLRRGVAVSPAAAAAVSAAATIRGGAGRCRARHMWVAGFGEATFLEAAGKRSSGGGDAGGQGVGRD